MDNENSFKQLTQDIVELQSFHCDVYDSVNDIAFMSYNKHLITHSV